MTERDDEREFRDLLAAVERLPKSVEPPRDLWPGIEARISGKGRILGLPRRWIPLAAAAALVLLWLGRRGTIQPAGAWEVTRLAGRPLVGETLLGASGRLRVGQWLETDYSSRAVILVGDIRHVDVQPGTRIRLVRARSTDHRLAPPRRALLRRGGGPGAPCGAAAGGPGRGAREEYDWGTGGAPAVRRPPPAARPEDAVSLWHLLARVDPALRSAVYGGLAALVPPPAGVTRDGVLRLEQRQLDAHWAAILRIAPRRIILPGIRDLDPRAGLAPWPEHPHPHPFA